MTLLAKRHSSPRADMPARGLPVPAEDRLHAKQIAELEECSIRTAQRYMGAIGKVRGRSARDRWVSRADYTTWCSTL